MSNDKKVLAKTLPKYWGVHQWLRRKHGPANKCENLDCPGVSKRYEWANLSREYKYDLSDWQQMCMSCHRRHDARTWCLNGHVRTEENTKRTNDGGYRCIECREAIVLKWNNIAKAKRYAKS